MAYYIVFVVVFLLIALSQETPVTFKIAKILYLSIFRNFLRMSNFSITLSWLKMANLQL